MPSPPTPEVTDPPFSPPETSPSEERRALLPVSRMLMHRACRMVDSSISAHPYLTPEQRREAFGASARLRETLTRLMT